MIILVLVLLKWNNKKLMAHCPLPSSLFVGIELRNNACSNGIAVIGFFDVVCGHWWHFLE